MLTSTTHAAPIKRSIWNGQSHQLYSVPQGLIRNVAVQGGCPDVSMAHELLNRLHPDTAKLRAKTEPPPTAGRWLYMDASIPIADRYRAQALDCLHDARELGDEDLKTVFHRLAVLWIVLAHHTEDDEAHDRTLVRVLVDGIGENLTNDEKRAHLTDLRRGHLIDQVCIQEILPPESDDE